MERIALKRGAIGGGHHKAVIESGVVRHHNRAVTIAVFHAFTYHFEDGMQSIIFAHRAAQRIIGVDTVKRQRFRFEVGAFERLNVEV